MPGADRETRLKREKGKASVRALHLSELEAAGAARARALAEADKQLDRVARLLPDALSGGLSLSEIGRVAGVSRQTLYELRARYSDLDGDLRLAVLQSVAWMQPVTVDELAEHLGRDAGDISRTLSGFVSDDFVDVGSRRTEDGEEVEFDLTAAGASTLDNWVFIEDLEPGEIP
jgi:chromosome segregation and condensation protein ScpB